MGAVSQYASNCLTLLALHPHIPPMRAKPATDADWTAIEQRLPAPVRAALAEAEQHLAARHDAAAKHADTAPRSDKAQLTTLRRMVLAALAESATPLGAYDVMEKLGVWLGRGIAPPTVYRSIDYLVEAGLVSKVASRNAFMLCAHAGHPHDCVFFICDRCGGAEEVEDGRLDTLIAGDAANIGFTPRTRTLEIAGTCRRCA
jgi:Fur family transcriptional regulator, zinc uptake regulator